MQLPPPPPKQWLITALRTGARILTLEFECVCILPLLAWSKSSTPLSTTC